MTGNERVAEWSRACAESGSGAAGSASIRSEPMFSVIIPTYNRGPAILRTLSAVRRQNHDSFEIVVVDDGSTDDTYERVAGIGDPRIRLVSRKNGGISAARNTGAQHARGRYLAPIDDDDVPHSDWLDHLGREVRKTGASFVSCGYRQIDAASGTVEATRLPTDRGKIFDDQVACLLAGTFVVRRDHYLDVGGFAEGLQSSHQTEFALRMLPACVEHGWGVGYVSRPLVDIYRRDAASRIERNPRKLLLGTEYILHNHRARLAASGRTVALFHSVAGVAAYRLGETARARGHLWAAWRAQPFGWKFAARFLVSLLPPVAAEVWGDRRLSRSIGAHRRRG